MPPNKIEPFVQKQSSNKWNMHFLMKPCFFKVIGTLSYSVSATSLPLKPRPRVPPHTMSPPIPCVIVWALANCWF